MQIQFSGGAGGDVTGSLHIVEAGGRRFLLDCGMIQGDANAERRNLLPFDFDPESMDAVLISHAHIDHIGRLPLLVKRGYRGPIYAQRATADLMPIMLLDAAGIQEGDAERFNRRLRSGQQPMEPLYTRRDVEQCLSLIQACEDQTDIDLGEGVVMHLHEAGHILGACSIELRHGGKTLLFSGDLGPRNTPILRDPAPPPSADLVLLESTYGDRLHRDKAMTISEMGEILDTAARTGGKVIIPAFAVGRTQELLYWMAQYYEEWNLRMFRIFIDSPMAIKVIDVYERNKDLFDEHAREVWQKKPNPFSMPNLTLSESVEDSQAINEVRGPAIIIAGSGMANAGRVLHHLRHHLPNPTTQVCIVGYQGYGTLGRRLVDGAKTVRIHGRDVPVKATVHTLGGLSAHADQKGLTDWYGEIKNRPPVVLVHGEDKAREAMAAKLAELYGADVDLAMPGETRTV